MANAGVTPDLPDPGGLSYLIPLWHRLGRAQSNGFGPQPVPHVEVQAFSNMERLTTDEARVLRAMSCAYVDGLQAGHNILAIPPWDGE